MPNSSSIDNRRNKIEKQNTKSKIINVSCPFYSAKSLTSPLMLTARDQHRILTVFFLFSLFFVFVPLRTKLRDASIKRKLLQDCQLLYKSITESKITSAKLLQTYSNLNCNLNLLFLL